MRVAIMGARGFVGLHLIDALMRFFKNRAEIIATSKTGGRHTVLGSILPLDVTDRVTVSAFISDARPTHVIHLAGIAATGAANMDADLTWRTHLDGTLAVANAIIEHTPECCLLNIGSGLIYGESAKAGHALDETALLAPTDEYSASKAAADIALGALVQRGLKCIRLRPFNHTGPGQSEDFVVPAFAMQIARIEAGLSPPVIWVGNLEAERDFLDVRDVTDAYVLAAAKSGDIEPGTILNIASGIPRRIRNILDGLLDQSNTVIEVKHDPARMRPVHISRVVGCAEKAKSLLGWSPRYELTETLADVLHHCRRILSDSP